MIHLCQLIGKLAPISYCDPLQAYKWAKKQKELCDTDIELTLRLSKLGLCPWKPGNPPERLSMGLYRALPSCAPSRSCSNRHGTPPLCEKYCSQQSHGLDHSKGHSDFGNSDSVCCLSGPYSRNLPPYWRTGLNLVNSLSARESSRFESDHEGVSPRASSLRGVLLRY